MGTKATPDPQWQRCLDIIKCNVKEQEYQTWFRPIAFLSFDKEQKELHLRVPTNYFFEMLDGQFKPLVYNVVWRVFGKETRIIYSIPQDTTNNISVNMEGSSVGVQMARKGKDDILKPPAPKRQVDELDSQLNREYSFDNFIEGDSNRLARSVGQSIAENPQQVTFNPLFIYGVSGVGKTHLVNAIGTRAKELFPQRRVLYVGAHQFTMQYGEATMTNRRPEFLQFYQTIDLLIIDDIQELSGQSKTQTEFFHIFNHLKQNGKQIILTSDRPPTDLQGMDERLLTRFKWGLMTELEKPSTELCRKILVNKIRRDGLSIPDDVIDYIAANVNESVRELEGIVNSLMAYTVVYNRDIDLAMAQSVVGRAIRRQPANIALEDIVEACCRQWEVSHDDFYSKSRKARTVAARQVAMFLAQKLLKMNTTRIGQRIAGRNHATVLHAINQVENHMATDKLFCKQVRDVEQTLRTH